MNPGASALAGAAIRRLRHGRGWTLAELSARSGVPLSSLSKVELGQTALGYEVLVRLCRALDVEIDHLVRPGLAPLPPAQPGRRAIIRAHEGAPVTLGGLNGRSGAEELLRRDFTPVVLEAPPRSAPGPWLRFRGDAYLMALAGSLTLHSEIYAPVEIDPGDGVYFDGEMGVAFVARGPEPAKVLLVHQGEAPNLA